MCAVVISAAALAWNETVVPYCSRMFQYVNNVEIRKRGQLGIFREREIWYRGASGFYSIDYVDRTSQTVHGLLIYRFAPVATPHGDVWLPSFTHLAAYIGIMMPLAWFLAIPMKMGIMGIVWACIIGVLGGLFPAIQAARLPVVDALRAQ